MSILCEECGALLLDGEIEESKDREIEMNLCYDCMDEMDEE